VRTIEAMENKPVPSKAQEVLTPGRDKPIVLEEIVQELMQDYGMTLEQAIEALDELP
jgi:hypothetical protein